MKSRASRSSLHSELPVLRQSPIFTDATEMAATAFYKSDQSDGWIPISSRVLPLRCGKGFLCHGCELLSTARYVHQLCELCLLIDSRWPPPPPPPPPRKDSAVLYPGDADPDFKPTRGDILLVNPLTGSGGRNLGFKGDCVVCYDGCPSFRFLEGDVVVRIGSYDVKVVEPPPPKKDDKKARGRKPPAQTARAAKKGGNKAAGKVVVVEEEEEVVEPEKLADLVTYKPYERLESFLCRGDGVWIFLGCQTNLDMRSKVVLETQCPGLTAFYRYYRAGTQVELHTLVPFLGEIILPEEVWQKDYDHEAHDWKALSRWYRPDMSDREKLRPRTILLRPMVGRQRGDLQGLPNTEDLLLKARYGAVEMYRFEGDGGEEGEPRGWVYWGRSDRICDTAYALPTDTSKPKFMHEDDRGKVEEVPVVEVPPEPVPDAKGAKKGKKSKDGKKDKKEKDGADSKKKEGDGKKNPSK